MPSEVHRMNYFSLHDPIYHFPLQPRPEIVHADSVKLFELGPAVSSESCGFLVAIGQM